jgi:hypothetical protein
VTGSPSYDKPFYPTPQQTIFKNRKLTRSDKYSSTAFAFDSFARKFAISN